MAAAQEVHRKRQRRPGAHNRDDNQGQVPVRGPREAAGPVEGRPSGPAEAPTTTTVGPLPRRAADHPAIRRLPPAIPGDSPPAASTKHLVLRDDARDGAVHTQREQDAAGAAAGGADAALQGEAAQGAGEEVWRAQGHRLEGREEAQVAGPVAVPGGGVEGPPGAEGADLAVVKADQGACSQGVSTFLEVVAG